MKIVIMESLGISQADLDTLKAPFEKQGHTFTQYERTTDVDTLIRQAQAADAMILANMPMPAAVIDGCPDLKYIDIAFTGVDHVAMDTARKRGITVSNASGYSNEAVAELGIGLALGLLRNIPQVDRRCRAGQTKDGLVGCELMGKTVGIVGYGKIGQRSAELYHAFGCKVLAHSRSGHPDRAGYVEETDLEDLLSRSDVVVLHCPLTDSTRGMINAQALARMKKTAILLNLARGPVVVEADLVQALEEGVIAGAGIDVFDVEPPLNVDLPILHAKNVIVTPHVAFATRESMLLRAQIVFNNLAAWLEGDPVNLV